MAKLPRCYWDSTCFLAWLKPEKDRFDACAEVIRAAESGDVQIATSAVALTEVIKLNKGPIALPKESEEKIKRFFMQDYIIVVQLTRFIAEEARALIWTYPKLRPKDAIHAATALYGKIGMLHTFDADFLPLDGTISSTGSTRLEVKEPHMPQRVLPTPPPDEGEEENEQEAN